MSQHIRDLGQVGFESGDGSVHIDGMVQLRHFDVGAGIRRVSNDVISAGGYLVDGRKTVDVGFEKDVAGIVTLDGKFKNPRDFRRLDRLRNF